MKQLIFGLIIIALFSCGKDKPVTQPIPRYKVFLENYTNGDEWGTLFIKIRLIIGDRVYDHDTLGIKLAVELENGNYNWEVDYWMTSNDEIWRWVPWSSGQIEIDADKTCRSRMFTVTWDQ